MDVALAIDALVPAAEYGGSSTTNNRSSFDALRWTDARKKPTWKELQTAWAELEPTLPDPTEEAAITAEIQQFDRAEARKRLGLSAEGG